MIERMIFRPAGNLHPIVEGPNGTSASVQTDFPNWGRDIHEAKRTLADRVAFDEIVASFTEDL